MTYFYARRGTYTMAERVRRDRVDDIIFKREGREVPADVTVEFSLNDERFAIDLADENVLALKQALQPFMAAATPLTKRTHRARREELRTIRQWLRDNGFSISERGRIPKEAREAWEKHQANEVLAI